MAGPVAAVKVIDHGSDSYYDNATHTTYKSTWKVYQYNKNYIVIKEKEYKNKKLQGNLKVIISKVSKNKIKLTTIARSSYKNQYHLKSYFYSKSIDYVKYSGTARSFYFKYDLSYS
jgi:hypothetical protein